MHKSSGYEDTSAEVSREEENVMRNREAWVAFDEDREAARCTIVSVLSHGRMKLELKMPRVLNANINTSAKTCIGVLYAPLFPLPQAGLSEPSPCLLTNSARRTSSGRSAIVNTSMKSYVSTIRTSVCLQSSTHTSDNDIRRIPKRHLVSPRL